MELLRFASNFTDIWAQLSIWQYASVGSNNDLVSDRQRANIWTKDGLCYWCIYVSLGLSKFLAEYSVYENQDVEAIYAIRNA